MKLENNWRFKTLENLEKETWGKPEYDSYLVKRCHELRKVPLNQFTTEDLRIMIGQEFGLAFLVPLALEVLSEDLFAEGDLYEGDLLKNILSIDTEFWLDNKPYWETVNQLISSRLKKLESMKFDTTKFYKVENRI